MADVDERGMDGIDLYADVDDFAPDADINEADLYDDVISSSSGAAGGRASGVTDSFVSSSGLPLHSDSSLDNESKPGSGEGYRGQQRSGGFGKRTAVIIANLTWWTTDRDITDAVANCGVADLKEIKFFENRVNGQSKGFATVILDSERSCRLVIDKLPGRELHGQVPIVTFYSRSAVERFDTSPSAAATGQAASQPRSSTTATSREGEMNYPNGHHAQQQLQAARLPPPPTQLTQLPPPQQLQLSSPQHTAAAAAALAAASAARGLQPGALARPPGAPPGFVPGASGFAAGFLPPNLRGLPPPPMLSGVPNSAAAPGQQLLSPPPRLPPPGQTLGSLPPNHIQMGLPPPHVTSLGQPPPNLTSVGAPRIQTLPPQGMMPVASQQNLLLRAGAPHVIDVRGAPPPLTSAPRLDFFHLRPPPGPDPFQSGAAASAAAVAAAVALQQQQRPPHTAVSMAGMLTPQQLQQLGIAGMSVPPPHLFLPPMSAAAVTVAASVHQALSTHHINPAYYPPTAPVSTPSLSAMMGGMIQLDAYGRPIAAAASSSVVTAASPVVAVASSSDPYEQLRAGSSSHHQQSTASAARQSPVDSGRRATPGYSSSDQRYRRRRSGSPPPRERDSSVDSYQRASPRSVSRSRHESVSGGTHHLSSSEFDEILQRNKTVSSSAISRAVQDASAGEFVGAIETLVTAIALIKQSRIANDDRCRILISSLQDTLHGIESKSYTRCSDLSAVSACLISYSRATNHNRDMTSYELALKLFYYSCISLLFIYYILYRYFIMLEFLFILSSKRTKVDAHCRILCDFVVAL